MMFYLQAVETKEEETKLETLFIEYRALLENIAFEILQNHEDTEDAVSQVFEYLAKNMKTFNKRFKDPYDRKTRGYLVTIVESRAKDMLRYKKRHKTVELMCYQTIVEDDLDAIVDTRLCLKKLPYRYEYFLRMKHKYCLTVPEIAKAMNISLYTATSLDFRAKKRFIEEYEGRGNRK